jgi:putative restriction endonuclease
MAAVALLDRMRRIELQRLTEDNGFGLSQGEADGWVRFTGLAIPHTLYVARTAEGRWLVGMAHAGVMEAVTSERPGEAVPRPDGGTAVSVEDLGPMIRRMAQLARSLPTALLDTFIEETRDLPRSTEAERLVVQRVGQNTFRSGLVDFWDACCPLTGISHGSLLRASHIKPWADCDTDAERLEVYNGLLLAAHLDAAFDAGLISFELDGSLLVSPALVTEDVDRLGLRDLPLLRGLQARHEAFLSYHREFVFKVTADD